MLENLTMVVISKYCIFQWVYLWYTRYNIMW